MRIQIEYARFRVVEGRHYPLIENEIFLLDPDPTDFLKSIYRYFFVYVIHSHNRDECVEKRGRRCICIEPTLDVITAIAITCRIALSQYDQIFSILIFFK